MKDAHVTAAKIDSILLTRMDKVRKIMETNGTFIQFPALASQRSMIRIQGIEGLHVERTVRELMLMVSNTTPLFLAMANKLAGSTILQRVVVDPTATKPATSATSSTSVKSNVGRYLFIFFSRCDI